MTTKKSNLYKILPLAGGDIRLLTLHPSSNPRPSPNLAPSSIICTMTVTNRLNHPPYEAISYCWGTELNPDPIIVNGIPVPIHKNLYDALTVFRQEHDMGEIGIQRTVWADALCINQDDLQEKAQQVQRMGDIYEEAVRVIAWLGRETPLFEQRVLGNGFTTIGEYADAMRLNGNDDKVTSYQNWLILGHVPDFLDFLRLPYWTRTWIAQEFVVAREVWIHWNDGYKMNDGDLRVVYGTYVKCASQNRWGREGTSRRDWELDAYLAELQLNPYVPIAKLAEHYRDNVSDSLESAVSLLWRSSCREPRDRIYGILKLATHNQAVSTMEVDYTVPLATLWLRVFMAEKNHHLRGPMTTMQRLKGALGTTWAEIATAIDTEAPSLWFSTVTFRLSVVKYEFGKRDTMVLDMYLAQDLKVFFEDSILHKESNYWFLTPKSRPLKHGDLIYHIMEDMSLNSSALYFAARPCLANEQSPLTFLLASGLLEEDSDGRPFGKKLALHTKVTSKGFGSHCWLEPHNGSQGTDKDMMRLSMSFSELFTIAEEQDSEHGSWLYP